MNQIEKEDFVNLISLLKNNIEKADKKIDNDFYDDFIEGVQDIEQQNYKVEDKKAKTKVRHKQNAFSKKIKTNYKYECAICGIKHKSFLIGSHIIPWTEDDSIRLDPKNGICLCVLHDNAFDKGYLSIDSNYRVIVSPKLEKDKKLYRLIKKHENNKNNLSRKSKPDKENLKYHRENIFKRN